MKPFSPSSPTSISVRYMVRDVDEAITFCAQYLGFQFRRKCIRAPAWRASPAAAWHQQLSSLGGSGGAAQTMFDGRRPEPGGWNRMQILVDDLADLVAILRNGGAQFRNDIVSGNGGKQILLDDLSGNPIELFELFGP